MILYLLHHCKSSIKLVARQRHEQELVSWPLRHCLEHIQVTNLHGSLRVQDSCGLVHQLGTFDVSWRRNDFGLWKSFGFWSHWQISLELSRQIHVFNKNLLHINSPFINLSIHVFFDLVGDFLSLLQEVLEGILTAKSSEGGVSDLGNWSHNVGESVISHLGINDPVIDTGIDVDCDVVLGQNKLPLQIHNSELLKVYKVFRFTSVTV